MPPQRQSPPRHWLVARIAEGKTNREMADQWNTEVGYEATTEGAVKQVRLRDGLTGVARRHKEEIPWTVRTQHAMHPHVRNLRLLARRNKGEELSRYDNGRLDSWLRQMNEKNLVVAYNPDTVRGFFAMERLPIDGDGMVRVDWRVTE